MGEGAQALAALVGDELAAPFPEAARPLVGEIRRRCGDDPVAAVVFYGSCLRTGTLEGVLDFYVVVDTYRPASASRVLAVANALLPPNVFYLEVETPAGRLRAKYAVISLRDLARGVGTRSLRSHLWARFCQPLRAAYVRDAAAREALVGAAARSVLSALEWILPLLPDAGGAQRVRPAEFWQRAFRETYAAEMRAEGPATIRAIYLAAPERFDRAARAGLEDLAGRGRLACRIEGETVYVTLETARRRRVRRVWPLRRRLAKLVTFAAQIKTAFTFGDWLPYALWKLERHTGRPVQLTARQRRHPLLLGWPVLWQLLRERNLR
ncbi:MAG: hypothetical protein OEM05_09010 [Myxococcales bacterium]|nr:hypothetical protein [Myxococcales bacterium]